MWSKQVNTNMTVYVIYNSNCFRWRFLVLLPHLAAVVIVAGFVDPTFPFTICPSLPQKTSTTPYPPVTMDPTKAQTTATFAHLKAQKANKVRSHFTPFSLTSELHHACHGR